MKTLNTYTFVSSMNMNKEITIIACNEDIAFEMLVEMFTNLLGDEVVEQLAFWLV